MNEQKVIDLIMDEVRRAARKHPHWPDDPIHAAAIVSEESGELIQASLQYHYESGTRDEVQKEAIQTAATCVRLLLNLKL